MLCRGMCATVCCFLNKFLGLSKLHLIFLKIQPGCVAVEAVCQHWSCLLMYWKFQTMQLYNTQSKSYWLINTQSRALQADWSMLENNEKGTLKIALACKLSLSSKLSDVFSRMDHYYQHDSLDLDAILRHSRELLLTSITGKRTTSIPLYTLEDENIARDRLFVCYGFLAYKKRIEFKILTCL